MDLNGVRTFVEKNFLALSINATAGALTGVVLGINPLITTASGAISGALQAGATIPRNFVLNKLDSKLSGVAKVTALAAAAIAIYSVHVPVLVGTAKFLFDTQIGWKLALGATVLGGGLGLLEIRAAEHLGKEGVSLT